MNKNVSWCKIHVNMRLMVKHGLGVLEALGFCFVTDNKIKLLMVQEELMSDVSDESVGKKLKCN